MSTLGNATPGTAAPAAAARSQSPLPPMPLPRAEPDLDLMMDRLPLINVYVQRIYTSAHRQLMRDISMHKGSVNTVINFAADSFLII